MDQKASVSGGVIRTYGIAIALAIGVALLIRVTLIEAYRIPTPSMRPTLMSGDTVFVAKWPFGIRLPFSEKRISAGRKPLHGEVVLYGAPDMPRKEFIKRVVGLPGDRVEVRRGELWLNGVNRTVRERTELDLCGEEQIGDFFYKVCWEPPVMADVGPLVVPAHSVYVLNDLRSDNVRAREKSAGALLPISAITAKAMWIWLSVEPLRFGGRESWFSRIRFERMLTGVQ